MKSKYEFTDRYKALGISYPDPETMCEGQCEGTGWYPEDNQENPLWQEAHNKSNEEKCDGWHFIKCPDCNGTGKITNKDKEGG